MNLYMKWQYMKAFVTMQEAEFRNEDKIRKTNT